MPTDRIDHLALERKMKIMFRITDQAAEQLKAAFSKTETPENACLRIGVVENQVQLAVDEQRDGDTTIDYQGDTLVVIDPIASNALADRELDFDANASQLVLKEAG
jgi:Fe-S cluster assembly iron-binding protein IscA